MNINENKIAILDIDSICFAIGWGNKVPDGQGDFLRDEKGRLIYVDKTEEELMQAADMTINDILAKSGCTHYVGFIKGRNTAAHRYQTKSDYKSNRPKESPKWWSFVKDYLISIYNIHPVDNIEVDDAVNIAKLTIENSFIVAIDKDLLHLEGTHYNWRTDEWNTVTQEEAETYFWQDMIIGQPGDGVSGIPGKGKAYANKIHCTALSVLTEYIHYYGEHLGIQEYYKNYTCLKILDDYEDFIVPEPIEFNVVKIDKEEDDSSLTLW